MKSHPKLNHDLEWAAKLRRRLSHLLAHPGSKHKSKRLMHRIERHAVRHHLQTLVLE